MAGGFSAGGLISGLDSNTLIRQLLQIESQPLVRFENRIANLEKQRDALRDIRTQLQTLRNRAQDFRFNTTFSAFQSTTSEESVLTASVSGQNPAAGAYDVAVLQLASATVAQSGNRLGANINPNVTLENSGILGEISAGTFTINGVAFAVNPSTDSLDDILTAITGSAAGVTATYDAVTDRVTFENTLAGDTSLINFGASGDDSNFLSRLVVPQATQSTNVNGSTSVTSTRNLGAVDAAAQLSDASFGNGAVTAGAFSINGVSISIDPNADSLFDVISRINSSDAEVLASYDATTDSIRVVSKSLGSRTVKFGGGSDTSNFLNIVNLDTAIQTAGKDAQFTVNGGPTLTRNSNEVGDAISGVTLNLKSLGTSTVTVSSDDDKIVEDVQTFVDAFNESVQQIRNLTASSGVLANDSTLRSVESFLRDKVFSIVPGLSGDFRSLVDIGISTGNDFDSGSVSKLTLDGDKFREALRENRLNVEQVFANPDATGVADIFFTFLDEATRSNGFLNARAKANGTIDNQIKNIRDQITRFEERLGQKEVRLRRQFLRLERLSSGFQNQSAALSGLGAGLVRF